MKKAPALALALAPARFIQKSRDTFYRELRESRNLRSAGEFQRVADGKKTCDLEVLQPI